MSLYITCCSISVFVCALGLEDMAPGAEQDPEVHSCFCCLDGGPDYRHLSEDSCHWHELLGFYRGLGVDRFHGGCGAFGGEA